MYMYKLYKYKYIYLFIYNIQLRCVVEFLVFFESIFLLSILQ